ncbi:MAG TPA: HAD hydrolase-like protein [Candidatus Paceibacterota bacterium]|nr:HAD hydrolase-like protein [Candidatus Paceibacterota bacterium]
MLLILDFDGTLFDSVPHIHRGMTNVFGSCNLPVPTASDFLIHIRPPYIDYYRSRGVTLDAKEVDRLFIEKANEPGATLFPDVVPAIERFAANGHTLTIVSGNYAHRVRTPLEIAGIDKHFVAIHGEHEDKVEAIKSLVRMYGDSNGSLMVGDTVLDILHARQADVPALGIIRHPDFECVGPHLIEAGAIACVRSLPEVEDFIEKAL